MPPTTRRRRRLAALGCATALLVPMSAGLAGCGSGGDPADGVAQIDDEGASSSTAAATEVDRDQALLDFAACMRGQGVDFPDPQADENGDLQIDPGAVAATDPDDLRRGREACEEELADVEGVLDIDETEQEDQLLRIAQCLRENGLEGARDPQPGELGPGALGIDPDDPDAQAAIEACQDLIGIPGGAQ